MIYNEITILEKMKELKGWSLQSNNLEKAYVFKNFSEALAFIVQVGCLSEKQNHHAEIWNVYNKVTLRLSTHDSGGITERDFKLAMEIDKFS